MRSPLLLLLAGGVAAGSVMFRPDNAGHPSHGAPADMAASADPGSGAAPEGYTQWCASCHGPDGRDFVARAWKLGSTSDDVARVIREGYPLLGMPGYGEVLRDEDIVALTDYVLEQASTERGFTAEAPTTTATDDLTVRANVVMEGLETPWGMDFVDDTTLLVTEREGRIWLWEAGKVKPVAGAPTDIHVRGQGGLLDVMHWVDPQDGQAWVYLTYSKNEPGDDKRSATALVRGRWMPDGPALGPLEDMFVAEPYEDTHRHYGSRVAVGGDGKLYLTCGERGMRDVHPQTLATSPGKVHRFNPDGSVPEDNPFVGEPGAVPSIWSWGHRNPQGLAVHPETGAVWTHEHGPKGGDEVNLPERGKNYGWPVITFGKNYTGTIITRDTAKAGMEQPLYYWLPSIGACGLEIVHGGNWPDAWQGDLLAGSLSFEYLERLHLENGRVVQRDRLLEGIGRVRDIARNSLGEVFVAVEGAGKVFHLVPVPED